MIPTQIFKAKICLLLIWLSLQNHNLNTKSHFAFHFGRVLLHKIKDTNYKENPHIYRWAGMRKNGKVATNLRLSQRKSSIWLRTYAP